MSSLSSCVEKFSNSHRNSTPHDNTKTQDAASVNQACSAWLSLRYFRIKASFCSILRAANSLFC
jgi:hypothetical protein